MTLIPYLSVFQVTGEDSADFLHAQLATRITGLGDGECRFAAYCSARGQVIALLLVCRQGDDYLVAVNARLAAAVISRLGAFVLRARVQFEILEKWNVLGVPDPGSAATPGPLFSPENFPFSYSFSTQDEAPAAGWNDASAAWREMELRHGLTWLGPETSERFLPQMLGFDALGAVSFNKGCYPGQEIIARTRYLGKLKRKPVLLQVSGQADVPPGSITRLRAENREVDAEVVDKASIHEGRDSLMFLVSALEPEDPVTAFCLEETSWPAQRLYPDYG